MSHTAKIELQLKDKEIIKKVAKRMGIKIEEGNFKLFSTTEEGIGIFLKGWKYPAVIKENGDVFYDNYKGTWGDIKELIKFKTIYSVEKTIKEAKKQGYKVKEEIRNGKIKLILRKY